MSIQRMVEPIFHLLASLHVPELVTYTRYGYPSIAGEMG